MKNFRYIPCKDRYIPKPVIRTDEEIQDWEDEIKDLTTEEFKQRWDAKMRPLNDIVNKHKTWEPFRSYR